MPKEAISVTLSVNNLLWLRARATAEGSRSVSDCLDTLIREARTGGRAGDRPARSVVGTIRLLDPDLSGADEAVRAVFRLSLTRRRRLGPAKRQARPGST